LKEGDVAEVVALSLAAWEPVFRSFEEVLGSRIYSHIYPDWQRSQAEVVEKYLRDEETTTWIAEVEGKVAGFISYELKPEKETGEVMLLAVHPGYQNRGIGTQLNWFVLERMREEGMKLAVVGTGGDPGHAPARRSYEKAGYTPLPLVRYYKAL
jgi:ribosomal protein S18 acetylase RimI-like enzyme